MNFPTRNVTPLSPSSELMLECKDGKFYNILLQSILSEPWNILHYQPPTPPPTPPQKSFSSTKFTCMSLGWLHSRCASEDEPAKRFQNLHQTFVIILFPPTAICVAVMFNVNWAIKLVVRSHITFALFGK